MINYVLPGAYLPRDDEVHLYSSFATRLKTIPKKKSLKMEVELCLCSKALWS